MKTFIRILALRIALLLAVATLSASLEASINLRVSVKVILDAKDNWPDGKSGTNSNQWFPWDPYNLDSTENIQRIFREYNRLFDRMGWGFQFDLTEIVTLRDLSAWFESNFRSGAVLNELERQALLRPDLWAYRPDQNNIYINNSSSGVAGDHVPLLGDIVAIGATGYWGLALHELGHVFGLCHSFGCGCNGCGQDCDNPGDDNPSGRIPAIADTILDSACWSTQDDIASGNFSDSYASLSSGRQRQVDDIFFNLMSYHSSHTDRFTHDQWEVIVNMANFEKRATASGSSFFVDHANDCGLPQNVEDLLLDMGRDFQWLVDNNHINPFVWGSRAPTPQEFGFQVGGYRKCLPDETPKIPNPNASPPRNQYLIILPNGEPVWSDELCVEVPGFNFSSGLFCLGGPWPTLRDALESDLVRPGDRLQIKAGRYDERNLRIAKRLTLATDRGTVVIGRP